MFVTDDFNRADAEPVGGNWSTVGALVWRVVSNQLWTSGSVTGWGGIYRNSETYAGDQYSQIAINNDLTFDEFGVSVRGNGSNCYFFTVAGRTSYRVGKYIGGTRTDFASGALTTANNDVLRLEVVGNVLTWFKNGVSQGTYTDTGNSLSTGAAGVFGNNTSGGTALDTFEGGDIITSFTGTGDTDTIVNSSGVGATIDYMSNVGSLIKSAWAWDNIRPSAMNYLRNDTRDPQGLRATFARSWWFGFTNGLGGSTTSASSSGTGASGAGSSVTGSGASTASATSAGTASLAFAGSGGVSALSTSSGTGSELFAGTGSVTAKETASGTGSETFAGSGSSATASANSTGMGTEVFAGSGSSATSATTTGTGYELFTGSGNDTAKTTTTGSGAESFTGGGSSTTVNTSTGTGSELFAGSGSSTASETTSGSGGTGNTFFGIGASTTVSATSAGTSSESFAGSGSSTAASTSSGSSLETFTGTGSSAGKASTAGTYSVIFAGAGLSSSSASSSGSGLGSPGVSGSGGSVSTVAVQGAGQLIFIGAGSSTASCYVDATGVLQISGVFGSVVSEASSTSQGDGQQIRYDSTRVHSANVLAKELSIIVQRELERGTERSLGLTVAPPSWTDYTNVKILEREVNYVES